MSSHFSSRRQMTSRSQARSAFTLMEILIVLMIMVILASLGLSAYVAAYQQSRVHRTRAIIAKIDQLITEKYESYRTRAVPIKLPPDPGPDGKWGVANTDDDGNGTTDDRGEARWPGSDDQLMPPYGDPFSDTLADNNYTDGFRDNNEPYTDRPPFDGRYTWGASEYRLLALRELQRMELPNLRADVINNAYSDPTPYNAGLPIIARPSLSQNYLRRASNIPGGIASWSGSYEGAECLYLILAAMRDGEKSALDFFSPSEIGDIDGDGMLEIHDSWGNPIEFVRWPLGYSEGPGQDLQWGVAGQDDDGDGFTDNPSEAGWPGSDDVPAPVTPQTRNYKVSPDPFDPLYIDGRSRLPNPFVIPVALKPLIYSPGPDKRYSISAPASATFLGDPFRVDFVPGAGNPPKLSAGSRFDPLGYDGWADNITNHDGEAR